MNLRKQKDIGNSNTKHSLKNSFWKSLWPCRKADCVLLIMRTMTMMIMMMMMTMIMMMIEAMIIMMVNIIIIIIIIPMMVMMEFS